MQAMPKTYITTIRFTEEEKQEAADKAQAYGLPSLSAVIRFALKQLKVRK